MTKKPLSEASRKAKERTDRIAGGLALTIVGIFAWFWGAGFISAILWGTVLLASVPDSFVQKKPQPVSADAVVAPLRAQKKAENRKAREAWNAEYDRLLYPGLTPQQIEQAKYEKGMEYLFATIRKSKKQAQP